MLRRERERVTRITASGECKIRSHEEAYCVDTDACILVKHFRRNTSGQNTGR